MSEEKIKVRAENGKELEVVLVSRKADVIWVLIGDFKCKLEPTRNALAYAGSIMGREVIYERSVKQVKEELAREEQVRESHRVR